MVAISAWGRLSRDEHQLTLLLRPQEVAACIRKSAPGLPFGNGRSYGDVCLNPGGTLWLTRGMDRFISFDEVNGRLVCDASVLLQDIQRLAIFTAPPLPQFTGRQRTRTSSCPASSSSTGRQHSGDASSTIRTGRPCARMADTTVGSVPA